MGRDTFIAAADVRLHALDWGSTGLPVVLLAGLGDTAQQYGGLAPRLATRHRVLGLTRRGHGRSDRPDAGYDLDTFVADIGRLMDAFEIEQAGGIVTEQLVGYAA